MDRSTQVNFPIITDEKRRRMRRYNTSAELTAPGVTRANRVKSAAVLPRPRSMNFTTTDVKTSKALCCYDNTPLRLYPYPNVSDLMLNHPLSYREKVSPYSTVSSLTAGSCKNFGSKLRQQTQQDAEESASTASLRCCHCCKCADVESACRKSGAATPEGLSWRRLHMSRAKLKATATTSELLSGFAMIAMVELQINEPTNVPEWLFVVFAVSTVILVTVHIFALMISTYILPNIDAIAKLDVCEMVKESPHERMRGFIELAWAFSTVLGLFLFLVEVAILCWVKFWDYSMTAAIAATVIVIPVLIIFVLFAVHFYHSLLVYRCDTSVGDMEKLETMKKQLDEVSVIPV